MGNERDVPELTQRQRRLYTVIGDAGRFRLPFRSLFTKEQREAAKALWPDDAVSATPPSPSDADENSQRKK
jgi:hypothetical protein